MSLVSSLRSLISVFFRRAHIDREMEEELRLHIENRADDLEKLGFSHSDAVRQARIEFGGPERFKEEIRDELGGRWLETLWTDLRYSIRMLRKSPVFTAVALLTLTLGIGANTAIFTVVQGVILAPLPFPEPDRLVLIRQNNLKLHHALSLSYPDFLDLQSQADSFQRMAAFAWENFNLTRPGTPEHIYGKRVSAGFFATLGINLAVGREFSTQEDINGGAPVVILGNQLWRIRFHGSDTAIGQTVTLEGVDYTVVGVAPEGFRLGLDADIYVPVGQGNPLLYTDRTIPLVYCVARLKPQRNVAQAQNEMSILQTNLDRLYPGADRGVEAQVAPLKQELVRYVSATLLMLWGAVGIVLLIACANVANLLLARSVARNREFAIRTALGAKRSRIVRQLLTESVLLSLSGGALGLLAAKWGTSAALSIGSQALPRSEDIRVNGFVLLFAVGISLIVGILFGMAPALQISRADLQSAMKEGRRGSTTSRNRTQSSLVIAQMALTLVLLASAGLLFRTIRHLWQVNPGFDTKNLMTFKVGISPLLVKSPSAKRVAYQELVERIRHVPGVQAADLTVLVPLSEAGNIGPFVVGSGQPEFVAEAPRALFYWTGPDYLHAMGIPLLRGRFLTTEDTTKSQPVVVIDEVLAQSYFPNKDPIGQTLTIPHWRTVTVVGEVRHVSHWDLGKFDQHVENQIYASLYQLPDEWISNFYEDLTVVARANLPVATVLPSIRATIYGVSNDQPVYDVRTMQELVSQSMALQRFPMVLLGAFAGLALFLASIGIYGVMSHSVNQRLHEIGIRIALGAERRNIFRMLVGQGLRLALVGLAIGTASGLILARLISNFSHLLYGVSANDPLTFIVVSLLLLTVAVLACYIPARRAMSVDPLITLRYE